MCSSLRKIIVLNINYPIPAATELKKVLCMHKAVFIFPALGMKCIPFKNKTPG